MIEKFKKIISNNEKNVAAKDALKVTYSEKVIGTLLEDYVK